MIHRLLPVLLLFALPCRAQTPLFGSEIPVTINGLPFDAMEPFLSPDGNALIFNNLNDGITTSLYYAARVNDSTFNFIGPVPAVNQSTTPRLDAVASEDSANHFYWVSTRNYPAEFDNLFHVTFLSSSYTNFGRVHGNIYVYAPGWLIMDAAITYSGSELLYCNAYFNNCPFGMPCRSALAIAQKVNDSTFAKLPNSGTLFAAVNDTANYLVYAPQLSKDGLELYFTRAAIGVGQTEICVSVRSSTAQPFGAPVVLIASPGNTPEAPTISADQQRLYYHKKTGGLYRIYLRYRTGTTGIAGQTDPPAFRAFPNPAKNVLVISDTAPVNAELYNSFGEKVLEETAMQLDLRDLPGGIYFLRILREGEVRVQKIIVQKD